MVDFGNRLKQLRSNAGMTQNELANKLRVTKSVVSYYELHERTPSPEIIVKLADIFHVSTDFLLGVDKQHTIDVTGLSNDEITLLSMLVEKFRAKK